MGAVTLQVDKAELGTFVTVVQEGVPLACVVTDIQGGFIEVRRQGHMMDVPFIFREDGTFDRYGFLP